MVGLLGRVYLIRVVIRLIRVRTCIRAIWNISIIRVIRLVIRLIRAGTGIRAIWNIRIRVIVIRL